MKVRICLAGAWALGLVLSADGLSLAQEAQQPQQPSKFEQVTKGMTQKAAGGEEMWTLYHNDQQLLVELDGGDLQKEYLVLTSIARGIGSGMVLGGMSWSNGDDIIWTFRKSGEKIYVMRRNVRFRANSQTPEARAVELSYSDSVLYVLPIITKTPKGADLVDMTSIFMSDDQQIGQGIGQGFGFVRDRSTWEKVTSYPWNVQLKVAAVYAGRGDLEKVPDPRGVQVSVQYSISTLPALGSYKPRAADDRVGYFLTAIKDFSDKDDDEHFVRYINRWDLQKKDAGIELSPPKEPIVFYVEKTVPVFLRPTVKAAILEWNKAYEKIGFAGAIEVEDEEVVEAKYGIDIDPENNRYNFFRWITAEAGFAMGPSRVDPRTGQILDADIIFDASFLDSWKQKYETLTAAQAQQLLPNWSPLAEAAAVHGPAGHAALCFYGHEMQQHIGFAATVLIGRGDVEARGDLPLDLVHQGIKEVVMHEVGHTLGLRHNFKASTWKTIEEAENAERARAEGTIASVMDYSPPNISAKKETQGLYYSQTIGPYDYWAIEYGYKPLKDEKSELAKIAARSGEPGLDYSTDEDTMMFSPDPLSNRFDLGKDPIAFVRRQIQHADEMVPRVVEKTVSDGEGYQRARQAFGLLFREYWRAILFASRFPGGVYVHRDHKADAGARPPFQVVEPARQREAMQLVVQSALASPKYDGTMLNFLSASRWSHWGVDDSGRVDFPIHEEVALMQSQMLGQLLNGGTLQRLLDNEFKIPADQEAYTLAEHLNLLVDGVFSEWLAADAQGDFTNRKPYVSSFRRNLQRDALARLSSLVLSSNYPPDARTLARVHLARLSGGLTSALQSQQLKLDDYSRAHLQDSQRRIEQLLNAEVLVPSVN
jgi:hypothetical protein